MPQPAALHQDEGLPYAGPRCAGPKVSAGTEGVKRTRLGRNIPVAPVNIRRHTGGEHQSSCFTETTAGSHDKAGHDTGEAGRQENVPNGLPMGGAEAQTAVAVARRQVAQSIFCNRRNQGQGQNGYGQSTGHEVPLGTGHDDEDQVTEQADDDRRRDAKVQQPCGPNG